MADGSGIESKKLRSKKAPAAPIDALKDFELLRHLLRGGDADHGYWGLPATGEYWGGCAAGTAAAWAYLKCLRESPRCRAGGGFLQRIALDMLSGRLTKGNSSAALSLKGQAVGFFSEIDRVLCSMASMMTGLDAETFDSLVCDIDKGLARTSADDEADAKAARSRAAREAWARRKARLAQQEATAA